MRPFDESKHPRGEHGRWAFGKVASAAHSAIKSFTPSLTASTAPKQGKLTATAMKGRANRARHEVRLAQKGNLAKAPVNAPAKSPNTADKGHRLAHAVGHVAKASVLLAGGAVAGAAYGAARNTTPLARNMAITLGKQALKGNIPVSVAKELGKTALKTFIKG